MSFAETTFTLLPAAGSAFVVFLVGVFAADDEFELPHATFQFIDGTRAVGIVFVVVVVVFVACGIGFGFGRTFIEGVFVLACGAGTLTTDLGTTTDGADTVVIGCGTECGGSGGCGGGGGRGGGGMDGIKGTKATLLLRGGDDGNGGGCATTLLLILLRLFIIIALFNAAFCRSIANRCISMPKFRCL